MAQTVTTFISPRLDDDFLAELRESLEALGADDFATAQVTNGTVVVAAGPIGIALVVDDTWLELRHIPLSYTERLLTVRGKGSAAESALNKMYELVSSISLGGDEDIERTSLSMRGISIDNKPSIVDVAAERSRREEWKRGRIRL